MSKIKYSNQLFLGKQELDRSWRFLVDGGFKKLLLQQTYEFGVVKSYNDPSFNSFKIEAGTNPSTIKLANDSFAIDEDGNTIYKVSQDNITIPNDSNWYSVVIGHKYSAIEIGTVDIDVSGNLSGIGTKFTEVLRGQPNFPARIKFNAASLNTGVYDVVEVIDDTNAVLSGIFQAESNLQYAVYGTFTPGHTPAIAEQYPFQYDSCDFEIVLGTPSIVTNKEFIIAKVRSVTGIVEIQDHRTQIWRSKADYQVSNVETALSPLIGVESIKYDHIQGTKEKNQIQIGWGFRSSNFTIDSSLRKITINAGEGGRFKSTSDFTAGDFNGWLVYEREGGWQKVLTSTKTGSDINLFLDTLIVDNYSSPQVGGEQLVIVPDAEAIELKFGPDKNGTVVEQLRKTVEYPISNAIAREWLLVPVPANSTYKYNVQYRLRRGNAYGEWRQLPSDTMHGYYDESSFDDNGVLNASPVDRSRVIYSATADLDDGYITFTANPNNYQSFQAEVVSGDVFGSSILTINNSSPVQVFTTGSSAVIQYIEGSIALSTNHIFDLDANAGVDGNEFTIIFKVLVTPNRYGIRFTTGYVNSGNIGTVLHYFTPSDLDWMKMPRKQIAFHCRKIGGAWRIYSAELPISRLGDVVMFGSEVDLTQDVNFDVSGKGVSDDYLGWALCNGSSGTPDLRGRFIAGYSGTGEYTMYNVSGQHTVTLTEAQSALPSHTHSLGGATGTVIGTTEPAGAHDHKGGYTGNNVTEGGDMPGSPVGDSGSRMKYSPFYSAPNHTHSISGTVTLDTGNTGSATQVNAVQSHENRPEYVALGFIMRIPYAGSSGGAGGTITYPQPTF